MSIHDLTASLDLKQNLNIYATCKQFDSLNLILSIYNNSVQADLTNYNIRLRAMKRDLVPLIQEHVGITPLGNVVTIAADEQLTTTSGRTLIEIQFINKTTGLKKATFNLVLIVVPSILEVDRTISKATYTLLEELENKLDQASDFFENIDEAITSNTNLENTISNSVTAKNNLESTISTGNTLKTGLENDISTGNTLKTNLETTITNANNSKSALETSKTNADTSKIALDLSITESQQFVAEHQDVNNLITEVANHTTQLSDIPQQTFITDKEKTIDVNVKLGLKADKTEVNTLATNKADKTEVAVERARINSFTALGTGSTTGDAELIDGRVGANGVTYPNVGGAIRGQIGKVEAKLNDINTGIYDTLINTINGFTINTIGKWLKNINEVSALIRIKGGDSITIKAQDTIPVYYTFLESYDEYGDGVPANFADGYTTYQTILQGDTLIEVAPCNAKYIWFLYSESSVLYAPNKLTINGLDALIGFRDNLVKAIDTKEQINQVETKLNGMVLFVQSNNIYNGVYTADMKLTKTGTLVSNADKYSTTDYVRVIEGKKIYFSYSLGATYNNARQAIAIGLYAMYDKDKNFINGSINYWLNDLIIPQNICYVKLTVENAVLIADFAINYGAVDSPYSPYVEEHYELKNQDQVDKIVTKYEIAEGNLSELASYENNAVKYTTIDNIPKKRYSGKRIVAISHDDLPPNDYINTRRIYNKYGYNANFNFILQPFTTTTAQTQMVEHVKKLIKDGNELGIHAMFQESFWWMNKMFDIRPNNDFTFAPTLLEVITDIGAGTNVFGYTVSSASKLGNAGFVNPPTSYADLTFANLTSSQYVAVISHYTMYANKTQITGVDLNGTSQTWTMLKWLEYWYNNLIDNSLGYSSVSTDLITKYNEDYSIPVSANINEYYPDSAHLATGKIVRHNDINNVNYSNLDYQKVGYFTKGLFKGASTCCNYEIRDRCIKVATAFCKYYFGVDKFTNYGRHGVTFVDCKWAMNGIPYDDRAKTVLSGEFGKVYNSITKQFENGFDILLRQGIKMTSHNTPIAPVFESQIGLYYGQNGIRSPFFNHSDIISYLTIAGSSPNFNGEIINSANLIKILSDKANPIKYCYENAGNLVTSTDGTVSMYIHNYFKSMINKINSCFDTGKIPCLSLDTIIKDASSAYGIELLCQYCYKNDIDIVPFEYARKMAIGNSREYRKNYFPNSKFNQSLLKLFNGESSALEAHLLDGWDIYPQSGNASWNVLNETNNRVLSMTKSGIDYSYIVSKIYGLPSGKYKLSFYAKQTGENANIQVYKNKNSSLYDSVSSFTTFIPTSTYQLYEVEFEIDEPYRILENGTVENQYADGYENNVSSIKIRIGFSAGTNVEAQILNIYSPKLEMI